MLLLTKLSRKRDGKARACLRIPFDRKSALKIQFATSKTKSQKGDKRPFLSHYHKRSNGTPAYTETTCIYTRIYRNKFSLINSAAASKFNFKILFPRHHLVSCHFLSLEFQKIVSRTY